MTMNRTRLLLILLLGYASNLMAGIEVIDDNGAAVRLPGPARRIISLSPHQTELAYAAGAGSRVIADVAYSDFPPAARTLPRVGDYHTLDIEAIIALHPDLVLAWKSGNRASDLEKMRSLGLKIFVSEPVHLRDIPIQIAAIATLAGTESEGAVAIRQFKQRYRRLQEQYAARSNVRVFFQIWDRPIMTVNGNHIVNDVIELCGGRNIFANLGELAGNVALESVIKRNPEVILVANTGTPGQQWVSDWSRWPQIEAVSRHQVYSIDPDLISRQTPRILDGAAELCSLLDRVRHSQGRITAPDR